MYPIELKREAINYYEDNKATMSFLDSAQNVYIPVNTMKKFWRNRKVISERTDTLKKSRTAKFPEFEDAIIAKFGFARQLLLQVTRTLIIAVEESLRSDYSIDNMEFKATRGLKNEFIRQYGIQKWVLLSVEAGVVDESLMCN